MMGIKEILEFLQKNINNPKAVVEEYYRNKEYYDRLLNQYKDHVTLAKLMYPEKFKILRQHGIVI